MKKNKPTRSQNSQQVDSKQNKDINQLFQQQLMTTAKLLEYSKDEANKRKVTKSDFSGDFSAKNIGDANFNHSEVQLQHASDSVQSTPQASVQFFNKMNNLLVNNTFMGWGELSILGQNPIINRICTVRAENGTSKWIEFKAKGEDKANRIIELEKEFERLKVKDIIHRAWFLTHLFGGCLIYPKIKGDETDEERMEELVIDNIKIEKGSLEYLQVIEPTWYVPIRYVTDDPFSKWFYKPEMYVALGRMIHESRVMHCVFKEPPNIFKPTYMFNGYSMTQFCVPYVMGAETIRTEIVSIVGRYNINILKTNMESIATGSYDAENSQVSLQNRLTIFNLLRTNMGTLAIDFTNEDFIQMSMNLSNLDTLMSQNFELICCVAETPATVLFGTSPQGFNSAGSHELTTFYDGIKAEQSMMSSHVTKLMHLAMLNIWGEIDNNIAWDWKELEEANELEQSQIRLNTVSEITMLVTNGIITPQQAAEKLRDDENSGWNNLEILEEYYKNAIENDINDPDSDDDDAEEK